MSDLSQDSSNTKVSVAKNLTAVMNVAAVTGGRSFTDLVKTTDTKLSSIPVKLKGAPKRSLGLSPVRQANTAEEMAILLTPLISERFALPNSVTKKLCTQLALYFKDMGIVNESCLGIMTDSSSWAVPESLSTTSQSLEHLTVPVLLLLTKLATYTVQLRNEKLHLTMGVLFTDVRTWYNKQLKKEIKKRPKAVIQDVKIQTTPTQDHKIQFFKFPTFQVDTLQGEVFY